MDLHPKRGGKRENTRKKAVPVVSANGRWGNMKALVQYLGKPETWIRARMNQADPQKRLPGFKLPGAQEWTFDFQKIDQYMEAASNAPEISTSMLPTPAAKRFQRAVPCDYSPVRSAKKYGG